MNTHRKLWNEQQQRLQRTLLRPDEHQQALELFLDNHAMVHAAAMSQSRLWSFEDEVWEGLNEAMIRRIPHHCEHSIVWVMWHIARIEDVTMNLLVAGRPQVMNDGHWLEPMNAPISHTGNSMDEAGVAHLSDTIDIEALWAYRIAVGRRTRDIFRKLLPADLKQKVKPERLKRIWDEGAVIEEARDIVDCWAGRTIAGLLLMPATRHNFVHLNEALRLKNKRA